MKNPVIEMASTDNIKRIRPLKWLLQETAIEMVSTDYLHGLYKIHPYWGSSIKSTVLFIKSAFNTSIFTISPSLYIFFVCSPII